MIRHLSLDESGGFALVGCYTETVRPCELGCLVSAAEHHNLPINVSIERITALASTL